MMLAAARIAEVLPSCFTTHAAATAAEEAAHEGDTRGSAGVPGHSLTPDFHPMGNPDGSKPALKACRIVSVKTHSPPGFFLCSVRG